MGHKSHDPCFHAFLMEARVMTFAAHCTVIQHRPNKTLAHEIDKNKLISMRQISRENVLFVKTKLGPTRSYHDYDHGSRLLNPRWLLIIRTNTCLAGKITQRPLSLISRNFSNSAVILALANIVPQENNLHFLLCRLVFTPINLRET